jgi:DNA mismatch repair ATPase MutS
MTEFHGKIKIISDYKLSSTKIGELGHVLKCFYELYDSPVYNDAFLYSFGFHGYIDNLEGLIENIKSRKINFAKFKGKQNRFKAAYYPAVINNPVKNDYTFDKSIIITGPNASGKTTVLKSSLINVILSQQMGCGCYQRATIQPFKYIHCYLNIPDTSGRDSLFQAEARRCKWILDTIKKSEAGESHFCVFDELYSGTNPEEAVSSAFAFMNYLVKQNVKCILTTHFHSLCNLLENENVKNFHMKTTKINDNGDSNDSNDFQYTYLLKKGVSKVRGGMKVLCDMDYPKEIMDTFVIS